jgi:hypothetical protein
VIFGDFEHFWRFLVIFGDFEHFWRFLVIFGDFEHFWAKNGYLPEKQSNYV